MTPQKRAKKIVERFSGMTFSGGLGSEWLKSELATKIEEAEREASDRTLIAQNKLCEQHAKESFLQGYESARTQAAEIAENEPCTHCGVCPKMIGRMIRAMKPKQ